MYGYYNPNEILPNGWLKDQLKIQASGLAGNLHKVWPDISDSACIGGKHESWERVPYWLDGFIPMAYFLKDKELIAVAEKYINEIISRQQKDGWICPCKKNMRSNYDIWAGFLIGKVLTVYYDFSKDEKALICLYKFMKCLYKEFSAKRIALFNRGYYRWYECFIPLQLLSDFYKENWIIELAMFLKENGANYFDYIKGWKRPLNKWTFYTHTVNLSMMLKAEAVYCSLLKTKPSDDAEKLWNILEKYNGTAAATHPKSRKPISGTVTKELYPYGCSKLRITEFPMAKLEE